MLRHTRYFLIALIALPLLLAASNLHKDDTARRKAMAYYYDALRYEAINQDDAAHELYKWAYRADSTFSPAALAYSFSLLNLPQDMFDSFDWNTNLDRMEQFVREYPGDMDEADYIAYIMSVSDSVPRAIRLLERADSLNPNYPGVLERLASLYTAEGDLDKAIKVMDKYLMQDDNIGAHQNRLSCMLQKGTPADTLAAIDYAKTQMAKHPGNIEYMWLTAFLYQISNQPDTAIAIMLPAEKLDSTSIQPKLMLAYLYQSKGDTAAYEKKFYEVMRSKDIEVEEKLDMLGQYMQDVLRSDSTDVRADTLINLLNRMYPHEAKVLDYIARFRAARKDYPKAIENIRYALDQDITNEDYWMQLMAYQAQNEEYDQAMQSFQESKKHLEPDVMLRALYASVAQAAKKSDIAIAEYESLIKSFVPSYNPDDTLKFEELAELSYDQLYQVSGYLQSLGDVYYPMDSVDKAFRFYENAITVFPFNSMALNNYAYFLSNTKDGDLDKALEMAKKAWSYDQENSTVLDTYAWVLFKRGEYKEALQYQQAAIEAALEADEESAELYSHYGDILFMNGEPDKALENWEKALTKLNANTDKDLEPLLKKKIKHKTFFWE